MKNSRRRFLQLAAAAAVTFPAAARTASAQSYPTRPLRVVVGFPAGSSTDIQARVMGPWLSERLGQPVVIENKPGAGTQNAGQAGGKPPPPGYTLPLRAAPQPSNGPLH